MKYHADESPSPRKPTQRRFLRLALIFLLLAVPVAGTLLTFYDMVQDGVDGIDGLNGIFDIALSPDGRFLYAVGRDDDALVVFETALDATSDDATLDALVYVDLFQDGTDGIFGLLGASGVAASPDGRHIYATAQYDDTLAVFARDATTDDLSFLAAELKENGVGGVMGLDGASAVVVSPDDSLVVVAGHVDNALAIFARDATLDYLTFADVEFPSPAPLRGASDVALSPDSLHLYATAEIDDALLLFERQGLSSDQFDFVSYLQDGVSGVEGLDGASAVAVSPDGRHVFVAGKIDDALSVYDRDSTTGALTLNAIYQDGEGDLDGLLGPSSITVHPSGYWVLVTGRYGNTVALFERNPNTGSLGLDTVLRDGVDGVEGIAGAIAIASSDSRAYVAGHDDDAIASFDVDTSAVLLFSDGFESGDTTAWSETMQ